MQEWRFEQVPEKVALELPEWMRLVVRDPASYQRVVGELWADVSGGVLERYKEWLLSRTPVAIVDCRGRFGLQLVWTHDVWNGHEQVAADGFRTIIRDVVPQRVVDEEFDRWERAGHAPFRGAYRSFFRHFNDLEMCNDDGFEDIEHLITFGDYRQMAPLYFELGSTIGDQWGLRHAMVLYLESTGNVLLRKCDGQLGWWLGGEEEYVGMGVENFDRVLDLVLACYKKDPSADAYTILNRR